MQAGSARMFSPNRGRGEDVYGFHGWDGNQHERGTVGVTGGWDVTEWCAWRRQSPAHAFQLDLRGERCIVAAPPNRGAPPVAFPLQTGFAVVHTP